MEQINQPTTSERVGRLGSANAAQCYNIGLRGSISESDHELLALLKGLKESKDFTNASMQLGNQLEDMIFDCLKQQYPNAVSNPYYKSKKLSSKYGFDIGGHIDYEILTSPKDIHWIENKAFKNMDNIKEVEERVRLQLAWHWMLLLEMKKELKLEPTLMLSYYDTTDWDGVFDAENLNITKVDTLGFDTIIKTIKKGLKIISEALPTFEYSPKEEMALESTALPMAIQGYFTKLRNIQELLKEAEKEEKEFKQKMYAMMEQNNIKKIDLIDLNFSLTRVLPTVSTGFDKKSLQKEHPKIYEKFVTSTPKEGYLKLTFKKEK